MWTQEAAVRYCRDLQKEIGHKWVVALGGGCLHKDGPRPDLDIVLFKHSEHKRAKLPDLGNVHPRPWGFKDLINHIDYTILRR